MGDFLPGDRSSWSVIRWWQVSFALIVTVALTTGGVHWFSDRDRFTAGSEDGPSASVAQGFADAALAAFSTSTTVPAANQPALTAAQRSAGLPTDPVTGLTSHTPAGPVQVVLPGGLGAAQSATGGQVVYPDAGAGFDMLAENTGSGTRTVARIDAPDGVRMVTTFVRTPAETVMLVHTNGYLTINRATPTAETVGMFSPSETRDATGRLVPSSYVVKQLAPQLYVLAEVLDPRPDTVWPVYVDPPLHVGGPGGTPLPAGLFDSITSTISSAAGSVTSAASTAMSATVSGAKAVGTFVKENPLESAMLVGGVALALTGVGGPAGAAAIAGATVNLASAGVDIAAAAMPDNQTLGTASTILGVASMVTPQGAVKKVAEEGAEQLLKHTDDIVDGVEGVVDVAKAAPTPPTQLADEVTAAGAKAPAAPLAETPKAPQAPPPRVKPPPGEGPFGPRSLPQGCTLDCGHVLDHPAAVYDQREVPGHYDANLNSITNNEQPAIVTRTTPAQRDMNRRAATGHLPSAGQGRVNHEYPYASTEEGGHGADVTKQPRRKSNIEGDTLRSLYQRQGVKPGDRFTTAYRGDDGQSRCIQCAASRQQQRNQQQGAANIQRNNAIRSAANSNNPGGQRGGGQQSGHRDSGDKPHRTQSKKPKKQSNSHKKRKGQK